MILYQGLLLQVVLVCCYTKSLVMVCSINLMKPDRFFLWLYGSADTVHPVRHRTYGVPLMFYQLPPLLF